MIRELNKISRNEIKEIINFLSSDLVFILLYSNYLRKFCSLEDFSFPLAYFNSQLNKKLYSDEGYLKAARYGCYYLYSLGLMDLTGLNGEVIVSDLGRELIHSEDLRFRFGSVYVKLAQFIQEVWVKR